MSYKPHGLGSLPPTSWIRSLRVAAVPGDLVELARNAVRSCRRGRRAPTRLRSAAGTRRRTRPTSIPSPSAGSDTRARARRAGTARCRTGPRPTRKHPRRATGRLRGTRPLAGDLCVQRLGDRERRELVGRQLDRPTALRTPVRQRHPAGPDGDQFVFQVHEVQESHPSGLLGTCRDYQADRSPSALRSMRPAGTSFRPVFCKVRATSSEHSSTDGWSPTPVLSPLPAGTCTCRSRPTS